MKSLQTAFSLLLPRERRSALLILPLILLNGFADMVGVAMIFPFLKVLGEPELVFDNAYLSRIYDTGGFQTIESFVVFMGLGFFVVLMLTAALKIVTVYVANRWLEGRIHSLSRRLLTMYLRQPYEIVLQRNSSELVAIMLSETGRVVSQVFRAFSEFVVSSVTLIFMVVLLLYISPLVTLIAIGAFSALYVGLLLGVRRVTRQLGKTILETNRIRHRLAWEALAGGKQVRLLNRERSLIGSYVGPSRDFAHANAVSNTVRTAPKHIIEALAIGGTVLMTLGLMARSGGIGSTGMENIVPTLGVFVLAIYRMMPAFQKGYNSYVSIQLTNASAEVIAADLHQTANLPKLPIHESEPILLRESIEFRNVSYRYPGADTTSLTNINLKIDRGMSVGIVGRTGAGKTTLMDLILGLLEPTDGDFLIDGVRPSASELRSWRANVGYVQQDIFLSDATIAQNIAFGVPETEIDRVRLRSAARMAQIEDYILNDLPNGYDTLIGERGTRLSGGQRQRISIARALYLDPGVIVFDEATSALDNATEDRVMAEITKLAGDRTLIMVAHRLTTVRDCDIILTLDGGVIESLGSYQDVVQRDRSRMSVVTGGA